MVTSLGRRAPAAMDMLRGLAALVVMVGHVRGLLFINYGDIPNASGLMNKAFYLVTSLGHQMVMIFFVLSGYLISKSVYRLIERGWSWRTYLVQRLARLWVVLLPALLLGTLWDLMGMHLFAATGVYNGLAVDKFILPFAASAQTGLPMFVGNLLFLQGILVPTFGSNGPLWSLSYEFWYYMLFPLLALLARDSHTFRRFVYISAIVALGWFVGARILVYFGIWLLGAVVGLLPAIPPCSPTQQTTLRLVAVGLLMASAVAAKVLPVNDVVADYLVGMASANFLYVLITTRNWAATSPIYVSISKYLASFSYTLYVTHFPPLVFIHAWLFKREAAKWYPNGYHLMASVAIAIAAVGYAWGISILTEAKTNTVRRKIEALLNRKPPKASNSMGT